MDTYRAEIREYMRACEYILSLTSMDSPLTKEECDIVEYYARTLMEKCPSSPVAEDQQSECHQ